jgi:transposase
MLLKTLLNYVEKHKSFVYGTVHLVLDDGPARIEVQVRSRKNGRPLCSGCEQPGGTYDTLRERRFQYVPLWGIAVVFLYAMRRVNCQKCGVKVEKVPWAQGKHRLTTSFSRFLAVWARRLAWKEVASIFGTTWSRVYDAVRWAVAWGREHQDLSGITAIGVDEVAYKKGHNYLTVVYQLNDGCRRLLWIGKDRTEETLRGFFSWFGTARSATIQFVCSDMWQPYVKIIQTCAEQAIYILDRFHIMATMNRALDDVRRQEVSRLRAEGREPVLKKSRWCILKRVENLTKTQFAKLRELLAYNLKTMRAYLLKEDFQHFWDYISPTWAGKFLDAWCTRTMRSRIEPMKKVARSLRQHRELILNWFRAQKQFSCGAVEGLNNKIKTTTKKSYGFRSVEVLKIALYHTIGELPLPPTTHEF